ncbi:hypothetical protein [Pedobacter sp. NJ-S-72]
MNEEYISLPLVKNQDANRFELKVGDYTAFIDYKEREVKRSGSFIQKHQKN